MFNNFIGLFTICHSKCAWDCTLLKKTYAITNKNEGLCEEESLYKVQTGYKTGFYVPSPQYGRTAVSGSIPSPPPHHFFLSHKRRVKVILKEIAARRPTKKLLLDFSTKLFGAPFLSSLSFSKRRECACSTASLIWEQHILALNFKIFQKCINVQSKFVPIGGLSLTSIIRKAINKN